MNFDPFISVVDDEIKAVSNNIRKRVITRYEGGAFPLRFYLSSEDFEILKKLMHPRPITYDYKNVGLTRHSHPVPAELQRYAYEKCINYSSRFKRAIDIGGTPLRTPKNHHLCTLINDSRTSARYLNACLYAEGHLLDYKLICKKGAQKCTVIAPYAYMINVYDIPIADIPYIMEKHQILVLDIWMFLPHNLINKHYTHDQTFYKNVIIEHSGISSCCRKKMCRFDLNDNSNAYYHDYNNWKKYFTTTQAKTQHHTYMFEHIEQLGTFTNIRVTRTNQPLDRYVYRVLDLRPNEDKYLVPDVVFYWTILKAAGDMFQRAFMIDCTYVDGILKWCQRQADNAFNYPNFASTFDAKSISVYYTVEKQQKLVYKGIDVDHITYERLQISLFMIGAINRFNRTQRIGNMLPFLKNVMVVFGIHLNTVLGDGIIASRTN